MGQGRLGKSQQKCKSLISMAKGDRKPIPIVGHDCGVSKPTNVHGTELIAVAKGLHVTDRFWSRFFSKAVKHRAGAEKSHLSNHMTSVDDQLFRFTQDSRGSQDVGFLVQKRDSLGQTGMVGHPTLGVEQW